MIVDSFSPDRSLAINPAIVKGSEGWIGIRSKNNFKMAHLTPILLTWNTGDF